VLPARVDTWSLTSLQQRLVETGGRLVKHARYHEHIRPTRKVAWCIKVPTGTAEMEIPVYRYLHLS